MKSLCYLFLPVLLLTFGCKTYKEQPDLGDIRRFTPPAERGDAWAQYHLGQAYASHWLYPQANVWYRKAALQGQADAMYALGQNCLNGAGVPENTIEAYAWFDIATSQNQILARNIRESLLTRMTRAESEEGNRRAAVLLAEIPPEKLVYARYRMPEKTEEEAAQKAAKTVGPTSGATPAPIIGKVDKPHHYAPAKINSVSKASVPATGKSMHYGSTVSKGGIVQTAP